MYVVDGKGYKDLTIPVVQVEKDEYFEQLKPLVLAKGNVSGLVTFSEQNPWKSFNESGVSTKQKKKIEPDTKNGNPNLKN